MVETRSGKMQDPAQERTKVEESAKPQPVHVVLAMLIMVGRSSRLLLLKVRRTDVQIVRMAVTDRSVTSRTVVQHIQSVTYHPVSARTIQRRLQRLRRQWCDEKRMWTAECNEIVFTDESHLCLQHHDGRIRVWRHRGERMLNSCIIHRHTGPAPGIMVWGSIGYHSRTPLVRIAGTLNSQRYISEVLEPVVFLTFRGCPQPYFNKLIRDHVWHALSKEIQPLLYMAGRRNSTSNGLPYRAKYGVVSPEPLRREPTAQARSLFSPLQFPTKATSLVSLVLAEQLLVMELPLVSPASCELRSVIRFLAAKKNSAKGIHIELCQVYGEGCMSSGMVRRWVREFKNDRTDVHDEPRPGRPSVSDETIAKLKKNLDGTQFQDDDELEEAALGFLRGQEAEFFDSGFHK
ncbi:hypothetical protein LAZ67_21001495 [Cordylochernes scorpioides]|uniref:Mos1 transposase HTH domain-containing protein n=1 Tax=Cordylochernes scorpioides TaxID=51811 RepID=A0ABY6LM83_9ARAC|nr:hypothetical protein LAZ67_21001495 [Cordylochernes scorpioides]